MSGIAGIIRFDGAPVEPELVKKMTEAMAYRGPDGIHHWIKGSVAMGQCMLHTTPESLEEKQPLTNEDESVVLVMDGRVDNWEELRKKLLGQGAVLRNRSDAELVLRAYETWRENCLTHIDGDFALVIWDARKHEAFCARDRVGRKPFCYHWNGKTFVFSSELHSILLLPWVRQELNQGMLAEFLAWEFYSREETLWQGIKRLMVAHQFQVGSDGLKIKRYWSPDLSIQLPYTKEEEFAEHYLELFTDIVRRISRSHKTLACQVSGGLDSSAVFCMAEHLRREGKLFAPTLEGYTLAFKDKSAADELEYCHAVGEYLGIYIHEVSPSSFPNSWYQQNASDYREFPGYPNAAMFVDMMKLSSSYGPVLLTGEGGDEWLGGSRDYYIEELAQGQWAKFYDCFKADVDVFGFRQAIKWVARYGLVPFLPEHVQNAIRQSVRILRGSHYQNPYWLSPRMYQLIEERRRSAYIKAKCSRAIPGQGDLAKILSDPFSDHVVIMNERQSAKLGVELRHPFQSHKLIEYAFSSPERLRLRGDRTKYTHVRAMQELMPQIILGRKTKAEFSSVVRGSLDHMNQFFTEVLPRRRYDWLSPEGMNQLFESYRENPQHGTPMWVLWSIFGCDKITQ